MAKAVLELDPPTLGFECRYRFVDEARPSCRILVQTQREIGAIAAAFAEIAGWSQTQPSQLVVCRSFGGDVPTLYHKPPTFDPAHLLGRGGEIDHPPVIGKAEQRDIDALVGLSRRHPITPIAPPVG